MFVVIFSLVSKQLNEEVTYTTLTVQVTDIDDMDPKFDYDEFILNITEVRTK